MARAVWVGEVLKMKIPGVKSSIFHSSRGHCTALCAGCKGRIIAVVWGIDKPPRCEACCNLGKDPIPWAELFKGG